MREIRGDARNTRSLLCGANHFARLSDERGRPTDLAEYRNHIGGLLPKSFNARRGGDLPYEKKREYYLKQNLLAQSRHELTYENDPGFKRFVNESGLAFRPHAEFRKADLDARQAPYGQIAEQVWGPENLLREVQ